MMGVGCTLLGWTCDPYVNISLLGWERFSTPDILIGRELPGSPEQAVETVAYSEPKQEGRDTQGWP